MRKPLSHPQLSLCALFGIFLVCSCEQQIHVPQCPPGSLEIAQPVDTSQAGVVFDNIEEYLDSLGVQYHMAQLDTNSSVQQPVYSNEYVVRWRGDISDNEKQHLRDSIATLLDKEFCWHPCMCDRSLEVWTTEDLWTEDDESTAMSDPGINSLEKNFILWTEHVASAPMASEISIADTIYSSVPTIVAILDTGFDFDNMEYMSHVHGMNLWVNPSELEESGLVVETTGPDTDGDCLKNDAVGWDFVHDDNNPGDEHSHGTHVTSLIAMGVNALSGGRLNYRIMPVRVFDGRGNGSLFTVSCGILYAVRHGAQYINASWGYNGDTSDILVNVIDEAIASDVVFVTSMGNDSADVSAVAHWPSQLYYMGRRHVIAVGADKDAAEIWEGSNYLPGKELVTARGVNIVAAIPEELPTSFRTKTGTSMAVPSILSAIIYLKTTMPAGSTFDDIWMQVETDYLDTSSSSVRPDVTWKLYKPPLPL